MEQNSFDLIAIGDTVTDAFIRIEKASVHTLEADNGAPEEDLCFINGAKIPYEFAKVIPGVGNSANAAVAAARLGLKSALIADVGHDAQGKEIIDALANEHVDTSMVRVNEGKSSNYHYVLWFRAERTILIKHETFDYKLPLFTEPKWIYFSSLGENSLPYHEEVIQYMKAHPNVKLAFQPGTFQIKLGAEKLKELYKSCAIFFCNTDEARIILKTTEQDPSKLPKMMSAIGPRIAVITDGPKGLYAYDAESDKTLFVPAYPDPKPPYERTGAGDATSSTIVVALALGKPLHEALLWGPINAMSVVQKIGAQEGLLNREQLENYLQNKPSDYNAREI